MPEAWEQTVRGTSLLPLVAVECGSEFGCATTEFGSHDGMPTAWTGRWWRPGPRCSHRPATPLWSGPTHVDPADDRTSGAGREAHHQATAARRVHQAREVEGRVRSRHRHEVQARGERGPVQGDVEDPGT